MSPHACVCICIHTYDIHGYACASSSNTSAFSYLYMHMPACVYICIPAHDIHEYACASPCSTKTRAFVPVGDQVDERIVVADGGAQLCGLELEAQYSLGVVQRGLVCTYQACVRAHVHTYVHAYTFLSTEAILLMIAVPQASMPLLLLQLWIYQMPSYTDYLQDVQYCTEII